MKTVIEMARIAGVRDDGHRFEFSEYKYLERFAEIVRADEREACAKVCDRIVEGKDPDDIHSDSQWMALTLAVEIRARSRNENSN